jgi:prepilin-type N-terminal cleavage/methylation domain-containing protein
MTSRRLLSGSLATAGRQQRGFTLIELVIVVAVIGIIAVPTTIYFLNFAQAQALNGAAQQMVNHLNQARQLAITSSTSYRIDFDKTNAKLRFLRPASCVPSTSGSCTAWTGPGTDSSGYRHLENGARIQCLPIATITFNFLGVGSSGTIGLQASTGNAVRYVIVSTTGRVRSSTTATSGACT